MIAALWQQEKTIVDIRIPIMVVLIGSIVGSVGLLLSKRQFLNGICTLLFGAAIGGGIPYATLIFLNQLPTGAPVEVDQFPIQSTGLGGWSRYSRCSKPYVVMSFHGLSKKLEFECEYAETIESYTFVEINYVQGTLGFPIIIDKHLIK